VRGLRNVTFGEHFRMNGGDAANVGVRDACIALDLSAGQADSLQLAVRQCVTAQQSLGSGSRLHLILEGTGADEYGSTGSDPFILFSSSLECRRQATESAASYRYGVLKWVLKWVLESSTRSHRRALSLQMASHAVVQPNIESQTCRGITNDSPDPALVTDTANEQNAAFVQDAGDGPGEGAEPDTSVESDKAVEPDLTERPDFSTEARAADIIGTRTSSVSIPSWFKQDIRRDLNIDGDGDHDNTCLSGQVGSASVLLTRDIENLDTVSAVNAYQSLIQRLHDAARAKGRIDPQQGGRPRYSCWAAPYMRPFVHWERSELERSEHVDDTSGVCDLRANPRKRDFKLAAAAVLRKRGCQGGRVARALLALYWHNEVELRSLISAVIEESTNKSSN
jgi:hypothetical protein